MIARFATMRTFIVLALAFLAVGLSRSAAGEGGVAVWFTLAAAFIAIGAARGARDKKGGRDAGR